MGQCATCGTTVTEAFGQCPQCGSGAAGDETVAMPPAAASAHRVSSTVSRVSSTSIPDEGRFVPGTLIGGRYRVIGLLGRGGMGEVYRATDLTLAQSVALKFLPDEAAGNERLLERFHNEVRIARQVSHPNVCRVYDIGESEGVPFISMEYVDGEDLACLLQRIGRLSSDKALEIGRKLCAGLAAAHERGIIHRDLKPQNIMLNKRGEVVIMDFGLAAVADELHGAEVRNGTPAYMAPEQLRGDSVTAKSDLYSLGLIVYELFTGKRAYEGRTAADLLRAEEAASPPTITSLAPDVDPGVGKIIGRCLQPDPAKRPAGALSIAAALPGGDPLAAALAAGETPSPELVAASGKAEGFPARYAVPCLVFVMVVLIAMPFIGQPISMLAMTPMDLPPPVLEQKAREVAAASGYTAKPLDWQSWLIENDGLLSWLTSHRDSRSWQQLFAAESPVDFVYRQSPELLLAAPDGDVSVSRPPFDQPGMVRVQLDSRARLRGFAAIAPRSDQDAPAPPVDPASVFHQAGLDLSSFREVPPAYAPPLAFDARRAWTGLYPGLPNTSITIELASWRGTLTSFFIRWPWTPSSSSPAKTDAVRDLAITIFPILFVLSGLFAAIFFARRNIRLGRGNRQGAFRIAGAAFVLYLVRWLGDVHVVPSFELLNYLAVNLSYGLASCGFLWLLYIALEPAVRARWPHSLISWNRLLNGQIGDPQLGSHILLGSSIGVLQVGLFVWRSHWLMRAGEHPNAIGNLAVLFGVRPLLGSLATTMSQALLGGFMIYFLVSGMRWLLHRDWLAAVATAILLTLQEGNIRSSTNLAVDLPLFLFVYTVFTFVLLRMGLVPAIVAFFVLNLSGNVPIGSAFSDWYNWAAALQISLIAGITIYGFWRSQSPPSQETIAEPAAR